MRGVRFYVNGTTGADTLDAGRGESASKPFKTIQAAVQYVAGNYNVGSYRATIQVADGSYEEDISLAKYSGTTGAIEIRGNTSNIEAVTLYGSIYGPAGVGQWRLVALTIKNIAGQPAMNSRNYQAINVQSGAIVTTYDCKIDLTADGPTGMLKIALYAAGGVIQIRTLASTGSSTGLTIVANEGASIDRVLYASSIGNIAILADVDITAIVTGAVLHLSVLSISTLSIYNGATVPKFTGEVTGKRYQVTENSIANMGGNGEEFIPGTIAGTVASGGQYT